MTEILLVGPQSINQSINSHTLLYPAPRKVTIEKKDEINEYKKKEIQKKEKTKRRAYQCPPPFIMENSPANRAYLCMYISLLIIFCTKIIRKL
jgi:hypothetical protein